MNKAAVYLHYLVGHEPRTSFSSRSIHDYFYQHHFVQIHTPVLTSNDCEGGGEVFEVRPSNQSISKSMIKSNVLNLEEAYFNKKVFLTVSGQLHLEAMSNGLEKVYTFSPTFRAENSRTRRHLTEFSMIEAEVAFVDHLEDLLQLQEDLIKHTLQAILESHEQDINYYLYLGHSTFIVRVLGHISELIK